MKFLILIVVLGIALAISEAPGNRRYQGRPFNLNQRDFFSRFVRPMRPLPVILEKPEQSTDPVISPQLVENTLIQNVVKNPIDDVEDLPINDLVDKPDPVILINGEPVYEIAEENLIKSQLKNPFEEVNGTFNAFLGIPDVQIDPIFVPIINEPDFIFDPIVEIIKSAKETLIKSLVKNPFEDNNGNSDGIVVNPFVQIDPIFVPIIGEPDFDVHPIIESLETAKETLIKFVVKNPFEEIHGNSEGEQTLNGILGKPDVQINPSDVSIVGEPDSEVRPIIETLESEKETLIKSVVKNPFEEIHGNSEEEQPLNAILGNPDVQINPSSASMVGEPDFKVSPTTETFETAKEDLIKSVVKNPFEEIHGNSGENGILGNPDVQINPSVVSIVGEPDKQTDLSIYTLVPAEETLFESDVKLQEIEDDKGTTETPMFK